MANLADCNRIIPRVRQLRREHDKLQKQLEKLRRDHHAECRRMYAKGLPDLAVYPLQKQFYAAEAALMASLKAANEQLSSAMEELRRVERGNR